MTHDQAISIVVLRSINLADFVYFKHHSRRSNSLFLPDVTKQN